ncbi:recombinase family protein [Streptomyces sp. NPDC055400]
MLHDIGKPPYGYVADRIPHPVPARRSEGKTKTRLLPAPLRAPVVRKIFEWRVVERLSRKAIAERLNGDLATHPAPIPPDPAKAVGFWTASNVRDILTNPKVTGHMVWNRRARKTRGGKNNPIEESRDRRAARFDAAPDVRGLPSPDALRQARQQRSLPRGAHG